MTEIKKFEGASPKWKEQSYTVPGVNTGAFRTEQETTDGGVAILRIWANSAQEAYELLEKAHTGEYPFALNLAAPNGHPLEPLSAEEIALRSFVASPLIDLAGYRNPERLPE